MSDQFDLLAARMHAIREVGQGHAEELHQEVKRAADWREHAKANPLLTTAVAGIVGFVVVRTLVQTNRMTSEGTGRTDEHIDRAAPTFLSTALGALGGVAFNAARSYATSQLQEFVSQNRGRRHDDS